MKFVPDNLPKRKRSWRDVLRHALVGVGMGAAVALAGWLITADPGWFYAIPVLALIHASGQEVRPPVIRARKRG